MDTALAIAGVDDDLVELVVRGLVTSERDTLALLVTGSYAKGSATPDSDLDLVLLTATTPTVGYRTSFLDRRGYPPLHVSAFATTLDAWLERGRQPERWALGFPARFDAHYVWSTSDACDRLGDDPSQIDHPPAPPELEDLVEAFQKMRRASRTDDWLGARWHARDAAELMPRLLVPLNAERRVRDRREALEAALDLTVAPDGWRDDLPVALGLTDATDITVVRVTLRLGLGLLAFLREHAPDIDPQPGIGAALADGTLERVLGA